MRSPVSSSPECRGGESVEQRGDDLAAQPAEREEMIQSILDRIASQNDRLDFLERTFADGLPAPEFKPEAGLHDSQKVTAVLAEIEAWSAFTAEVRTLRRVLDQWRYLRVKP